MKNILFILKRVPILLVLLLHSINPIPSHSRESSSLRVIGRGVVKDGMVQILIGSKDGVTHGSVSVRDRLSKRAILGKITSASFESPSKVIAAGTCREESPARTFQLVIEDLGSGASGQDRFSITLSDGFEFSGILTKGNISVKK